MDRTTWSIDKVESEEDLRRFQALGVPSDHTRLIVLNEPPFSAFAESQSWTVSQNGDPVARITALIDRITNEKHNERIGHLVLFEAAPGTFQAVFLLLAEACGWLAARACDSARMGFRSTCDMPFLIDAYGETPTFLHRANPPYYHGLMKHAGFQPTRGFIEYRVEFDEVWRERYAVTVEAAERRGITVHARHEPELFTAILNECYTSHWGIPHYTVDEVSLWLREPSDLVLFAEVGGETAGVVLGCPDFNTPDRGILFEICVRKPFRGLGVNYALAARLFHLMIERGYTGASYTLVLDDNWPSRRTAENLGAVPARNFLVYERALISPNRPC